MTAEAIKKGFGVMGFTLCGDELGVNVYPFSPDEFIDS